MQSKSVLTIHKWFQSGKEHMLSCVLFSSIYILMFQSILRTFDWFRFWNHKLILTQTPNCIGRVGGRRHKYNETQNGDFMEWNVCIWMWFCSDTMKLVKIFTSQFIFNFAFVHRFLAQGVNNWFGNCSNVNSV